MSEGRLSDQKAIEAAAEKLSDQFWRLNNLYWIQNKHGQRVLFRMNPAQKNLYEECDYLNVILKARQRGFCLAPDTPVLTSDLRWVPIGKVEVGQELVAVDEYPPGGRGIARRMRRAVVQGVRRVRREAWRITFDDGREVVCTDRHPWLSKKGQSSVDWRSLASGTRKKLAVGSQVRWITKPWDEGDFEDGWAGGLIDGAGSLTKNSSTTLKVSRIEGEVLERYRQYLRDRGIAFQEYVDRRDHRDTSSLGTQAVVGIEVGRADELLRLLGQTRPQRFVELPWWEGQGLPGKKTGIGWATIEKVEYLGLRWLVDLQTSAGTYIANGFVSHNTTFIDIFILDTCLFNRDVKAGIIAHTLEDAQVIFRDKIKFPYDNLPESVRSLRPADTSRTREITFNNGSSIRVATSMRSGTLQILHVSEYGKISAKFPDKAKEIKTGAFETIAQGQMIFVESTAEGREGEFYELCDKAMKHQQAGKKIGPMDFKFHFYPWWGEAEYRLEDFSDVLITADDMKYFEALESRGIKLDKAQQAWYVKKKEVLGDLMKREHPSYPEEAFESSIEGAYYSSVMAILRHAGRLGKVPYDPMLGVNTFWDIGLDDEMVIWFHQRYGMENRLIDYYQANGEPLNHYARILQERGYVYDTHYMPHDARKRNLGADAVKTTIQMANEVGIRPVTVVPRPRNEDEIIAQIEDTRRFLAMCWIDEEKCAQGIKALDSYRKEWDERNATYRNRPLHNWASHGADALRTGAVGYRVGELIIEADLNPEHTEDF